MDRSPCHSGSCTHLLRPIGTRFKGPEVRDDNQKWNVTYQVVAHYVYSSPLDDKIETWKEEVKAIKKERMVDQEKKK